MPLASLKSYDEETAGEILAAAAFLTSPNPEVEGIDREGLPLEAARSVVSEIRGRLKLKADDQSRNARQAIDAALSEAMDDVVFASVNVSEAIQRAGQAGRLSPSMYKVQQPKEFEERFRALCVGRKDVALAINRPDAFQHLMQEYTKPGAISLFLKVVPPHEKVKRHALLVQCLRDKNIQHVQSAWRVFGSDLPETTLVNPLDYLEAFCNTFGAVVSLGSKVGKFINSHSFFGDPDPAVNFEFEVRVLNQPREFFLSVSHGSDQSNPHIKGAGILFCIDLDRYKSALRRHGFKL